MKPLRRFAAGTLFTAGALLIPSSAPAFAQTETPQATTTSAPQEQSGQQTYHGQDHDNIQTKTSVGKEPTETNFTKEQLLTATVHQAWLLSGKNEANFLEMVEQEADISAHNRGVTLPDSAAAGRRMGEYIKRMARSDTDQLLYAVVDKAVVNATSATPHKAGTKPAQTTATTEKSEVLAH